MSKNISVALVQSFYRVFKKPNADTAKWGRDNGVSKSAMMAMIMCLDRKLPLAETIERVNKVRDVPDTYDWDSLKIKMGLPVTVVLDRRNLKL